ncbi:hypothetical protein CDD81_6883 [Ophiocordyceps australis]|uniref:LIM zinc-binding domain-containing protein n=1 Tax=Ophiocordyceps australis TaxID=1399860 RepID=A0A2C5XH95_9HYPO|nr:hypothetical protein CDD81_6883 [Ophiocordyceps australis]
MKQTQRRNVFTCTFCHCICTGSAQVLGRSARLACSRCATAVLDLAVCWTCGELVLRGDECVSLGWCFWHRACYGCLLCGSRRVCAGVSVRALFECSGGHGSEIEEPPLCAMCLVKVEVDGLDGETVVSKGLRRIDAVDGGVTRARWAQRQSRSKRRLASCRAPAGLGDSASWGDVLADEASSVIWVDIHDPINGYTFKPNPLKPIPLFMQPRPMSTMFANRQSTRAKTVDKPLRRDSLNSRRTNFSIQQESPRWANWSRHSEPWLPVSCLLESGQEQGRLTISRGRLSRSEGAQDDQQ